MLTNKGKYGLKAAVHLARLGAEKPTLVSDIAVANDIPKKFLDTILGEMRKAGIVRSRKGRGGGYLLARDPEHICVGDIVRALDGPIAPIRCASKNYYERCDDCPDEQQCHVYLIMAEVRQAISKILDKRTLAEMRDLGADNGPERAKRLTKKNVKRALGNTDEPFSNILMARSHEAASRTTSDSAGKIEGPPRGSRRASRSSP